MSTNNFKTNKSYSSETIVNDVKGQLKTASDLYERYIESNASFIIDPVTNSEFLKVGWSENIVHKDTVVKAVEDEFSFVINLKNEEEIIVNVALKGDDLYLQPVKLTLSLNKIILGTVELRYNHFSKYTFTIPKVIKETHATITGKVNKTDKSSIVLIRSITAVNSKVLTDYFHESLFELERIKRDTTQVLQFLESVVTKEILVVAFLNASQPFAETLEHENQDHLRHS